MFRYSLTLTALDQDIRSVLYAPMYLKKLTAQSILTFSSLALRPNHWASPGKTVAIVAVAVKETPCSTARETALSRGQTVSQ